MGVFFMIKFLNDYSEGAHPLILQRLAETNLDQQSGYGTDSYSEAARQYIRSAMKRPDADVYFVSGGTQANLLVIAALLKPFESVIAVESGHINTHETGAIEATGHKIEYVLGKEGKLTPELIAPVLVKSPKYHTVKPRMVYISNTTELGTVYSKAELQALSEYCKANDLLLFMDGARLAMALASKFNDLTLEDIASYCDVFYIGGTKNGALLGEAVVLLNPIFKEEFPYHIKQRGALMAKGRLLGIQFETLFQNELWLELAKHANSLAEEIADCCESLGFKFLTLPQSNQIFPILPANVRSELHKKYDFFDWQPIDDDRCAIRVVTSWATSKADVTSFIQDLCTLQKK
ncbi:L-threonine aldolase [Leadbetterella byssophila DSM 17132]|uniref:L-threonine aldolase n=2 Tax=Leadbetterella TaxID=319458 RepID=E4RWB0_LEAB4|nr:L-threonine aldolase [Leadbetterella byssophila DSM 17132]